MRKMFLLAAAAFSAVAPAAQLDGIAARVDTDVITVGDVMNELRRNPDAARRMTSSDETEMEGIYRAALDALVERRLILKAAVEKKLEIPEWVIDNQLREIVHVSFGGDMNRLEEELAKSKMPMTEYRNSVKEDIIVRGMRQQIIEQFAFASPAAMKKESESKAKSLTFREAYDRIAATVRNEVAKKAYDGWIARLKENSYIKTYPMPKE